MGKAKMFSFAENPALQFISVPEIEENSEEKKQLQTLGVEDIQTGEPFSKLFVIQDDDLQNISTSMIKKGFDNSQVLHIWQDKNVLIDGYTRLAAAKLAGIDTVPVYYHSFATEADALDYAIGLQKNRRNLSDADLLSAITVFDKTKQKGERSDTKGKSAELTAQKLGVSRATIERARSVEKNATPEQKEKISNGDATINQVYNEINEIKKNESKEKTPEEIEDDKNNLKMFPEIETADEQSQPESNTQLFDYEKYLNDWINITTTVAALFNNCGQIKFEEEHICLMQCLTDVVNFIEKQEKKNV